MLKITTIISIGKYFLDRKSL